MRERTVVPEPEFSSYYGKPIIKAPVWKQPDVPVYLFVGGVAGVSAVLAEGAAVSGLPALERVARYAAAGGAAVGTVALVHDLGRPARFLNMLRVFKVTSPLSVGSWILAPFGGLSTVAALTEMTGRFPRVGRLAGVGAAVLGPPLATYTAALLSNTAVPAWHDGYRELPFLFAGSAASAAGGIAMIATPPRQAAPARRVAAAGAVLDAVAERLMHRRLGMLAEPYDEGRPGMFMQAARVLTLGGAALSLAAGRSRPVAVAAGLACASGSILTRFGVFQAGLASAKDPKYTVVPQRERLSTAESRRTSSTT